ncbi:hypothetical protein CEXT_282141 [Caerostris extrusa]|uniref:Secreted protein n=1 Tax=Caerostris extrusa TaxID=172846 RepID=A0AAV4MU59_CAEEX|nr:hypothetical protein CEXT_282141 [Caerostris extrusa]
MDVITAITTVRVCVRALLTVRARSLHRIAHSRCSVFVVIIRVREDVHYVLFTDGCESEFNRVTLYINAIDVI